MPPVTARALLTGIVTTIRIQRHNPCLLIWDLARLLAPHLVLLLVSDPVLWLKKAHLLSPALKWLKQNPEPQCLAALVVVAMIVPARLEA
jgi:hypothetical protein